jgi:threonine dehydratase
MLKIDQVFQAKKDIEPYIITTPLFFSRSLSRITGASVYLKLENRQATGSFKVRGAVNKLIGLSQSETQQGLVVASAGNHALGVAYAARKLGYHNLAIFVPLNCSPTKLEKLRNYAIDLRQEGNIYDEAVEAAREYQKKRGAIWISAYDDLEIITGQATIGLEIMHDLPETDVVIVPVGGGGLISGVASALHALKPGIDVIGIQPSASPSAMLSLRDKKAYDPYEHEPTMADGLAGGFGILPLKLASKLINQILLASEGEIGQAVVRLFEDEQIIAEPSGAISIAPLLNGEIDLDGRTVVCIISGGNLSVDVFRKIIDSEHS